LIPVKQYGDVDPSEKETSFRCRSKVRGGQNNVAVGELDLERQPLKIGGNGEVEACRIVGGWFDVGGCSINGRPGKTKKRRVRV